jgi:hypothetical protein
VAAELANMPRGALEGNQYAVKDENKTANLQNSFTSQTEAAILLNVSPRSVASFSAVVAESRGSF